MVFGLQCPHLEEKILRFIAATDPSIETLFLGDVHRLDDGDTMATWGLGGRIDRVSPSGEVLWKVNTELGFIVGYNTVEESLYR